ncbi:hypothetical protein ACFL5J_01505 [Thermodesulfobacteriota bacterium]
MNRILSFEEFKVYYDFGQGKVRAFGIFDLTAGPIKISRKLGLQRRQIQTLILYNRRGFMFSFLKSKYNEDEKRYLEYIKNSLAQSSIQQDDVENTAKQILDSAIKKATDAELRGIKILGNKVIQDKNFVEERLKVGLTEDDILRFYNRDYVFIIAENLMIDAYRFSIFTTLVEDGKSDKEAVRFLRKTFLYLDYPNQSHPDYQGDDADIYPEFTFRHEKWRERISLTEEREMASRYSTYNAMVRDLIRKGII